MSQHIKILRRIFPHIFSTTEISMFRCSLPLMPEGRAMLRTAASINWENHNHINNNNQSGNNPQLSCTLPRKSFTSPQIKEPGHSTYGNACPICRDEHLGLHSENVDMLKQCGSLLNRANLNREIVNYSQSKPEVCQSSSQSQPEGDVESEKPDLDKLQEVEKTLVDSLSHIFVRPMNYKIYRADLLFIDNIRGKRSTTLFQYVQQAALLRAAGHVKFAFVKFLILNTDISKEEGRITVRWRIVGIGAIQVMLQFWKFKLWDWKGLMERQGTWHDGVSYFDVDSNGLIYRHIADKMMVDKDKDVVEKSPKTVLAAGLLAALLLPGSSLQCRDNSSLKHSSKSITLP